MNALAVVETVRWSNTIVASGAFRAKAQSVISEVAAHQVGHGGGSYTSNNIEQLFEKLSSPNNSICSDCCHDQTERVARFIAFNGQSRWAVHFSHSVPFVGVDARMQWWLLAG